MQHAAAKDDLEVLLWLEEDWDVEIGSVNQDARDHLTLLRVADCAAHGTLELHLNDLNSRIVAPPPSISGTSMERALKNVNLDNIAVQCWDGKDLDILARFYHTEGPLA
eukprot:2018944-Rhodomonas_salina.2